jgi:hypothetical protein
MDDYDDRVRRRAYHLWQEEGCPPGREHVHWDKARELVAIEDNQKLATVPVKRARASGPTGEPVEPILAAESLGDLPTLTDQGEEQTVPKRRRSAAAAGASASTRKSPRAAGASGSTPKPPRAAGTRSPPRSK